MPPEEKSTTFASAFAGSLDVARRQKSLELAVALGSTWKNSAPSAEVVVNIAKVFETYLKEGN